jgi:hypothetical protein
MKKCRAIGSAALFVLALAVGCGQADKTVTLTYPPEEAEFTVAVTVDRFGEEVPDTDRIIYVQDFDDQRSGGAVGEIRNVLGGPNARVWTDSNVAGWIQSAIETELANAGFIMQQFDPEITSPDMMILSGEILKVSASGPAPYEAEVSLRIKLEKGDRELLVSEYTGKGNLPNFRVLSASFKKSLGKALNEAAVNVARDVECVSGY